MWKLVFIASWFLFCAIEAPTPGRGQLKGYCNTNSDCKKKQCCVSFATPRAAGNLPEHLMQHVSGKCENRGASGSECLISTIGMPIDKFYHSCPCLADHTCQGTGQFLPPLGELGTCVKECSSCGECGPSECCVSKTRPRGKRSTGRVKRQALGTCKPMGQEGSECLVNNGSGRPGAVVNLSCPCKHPLICVETGDFDNPLGKLGRCRRRKDY